MRSRLWIFLFSLLGGIFLLLGPGHFAAAEEAGLPAENAAGPIWVTRVEGVISPPLADYLSKTMRRAAEEGARAVVVELDTPGGLDSSMRQIIQAEIASPIPVVMYVSPQGSRAASAGVYILMGADVAAMAPQTNLGSAHPVAIGGELDEEMNKKVTNDAVAYIRALAQSHGRNVEWAEEAVRESVSLPAGEALEINVVDFVAEDLDDLLVQLEGFTTQPKGLTLRTAGAEVERVEMAWHERLLHAVVNPNVAYILMLIGIYGLIFELQSPGLGLGGAAGAISLLLALYAFQALPVNYVGLALIVVAVVLYIAEIKVQSFGALAAGGTVALILGGLLLFDSPESFLRVDWTVLIISALLSVAFFVFVVMAVARIHRQPATTGTDGLIGERGVARTGLAPMGQILIHGELWRARAAEAPIPEGETVQVEAVEGMVLKVRRVPA